MNFSYKLYKNLLKIEDQEEALTNPHWAYYFALGKIPGSDIKALQAKACEDPFLAYCFALYIPNADIQYCQEHACKAPSWAYQFAKNVHGADIKYCQKYACKHPIYAFLFIKDIRKSDKEYCFKHAYPEDKLGPDRWKSEYNKYIMKQACE